jgi:triosephosphate isomerase
MKRQQIVAGNWKMNNDLAAGKDLAKAVAAKAPVDGVTLILGTPYIHLSAVAEILDGVEGIYLSAQNCHQEESGAYTGEISAGMLKSVGAEYVILGHSERREYFGEDEALLAAKVDKALAHGLIPIFCCGEKLDIREAGTHVELVQKQLEGSVFHLSAADFGKIVIAYEPVWAIGTGRTASPEQAQEMHAAIRKMIADKYGAEVAEATSILYGGSCKPSNAEEIFSRPDVDGGLIGGASLQAEDFIAIANSF